MVEYGALPPEINSARAYAGPQSAPLTMAAGAWQALAANLESNAVALNQAIMSLLGGGWQGPSSAMMATGGAENVRWLFQAATQAQQTAVAAEQAALAVEAAHAGVVPPPVIEANRNLLQALIGSNFMGVNSGAIAACVAAYDEMWTQDATTMYGFSADAAGITGMLVPFMPPAPTVNPGGVASQAAAVAQAGGTAAGQAGQNAATAGQSVSSMGGDSTSSIMTMAPQFMSAVPQALQGLAQPLMGGMGIPLQGLGGFQSLMSPFMSMFSNPAMGGVGGTGALTSAASSLTGAGGLGGGGFGGGAGALSAGLGRGGSLGGLSVPATWAASAQSGGSGAAPISATGGGGASGAAPAAASVGGGAAPMAAMGGRENSSGNGASYGAPVRVLPRPR
ncbi:PPE family protein [Mycobacterium sp. URHB0021]